MTPEEQRIALAEWAGWKWYRRPATGPWAMKPHRALYHPLLVPEYTATLAEADMTERQCNEMFLWREGLIPDYPSDLNAVHELEKNLTYDQMPVYVCHLYDAFNQPWPSFGPPARDCWVCFVHTTAPQRCEALCRTLFPERFK